MSKLDHHGINDQRKAAIHRKADAGRLLEHGKSHTRGAMYLGGYAIECKIKAIAMELHSCVTLAELRQKLDLREDEVYVHGLESLLRTLLPGSVDRMQSSPARLAFAGQVNHWNPAWRYNPMQKTPEEARVFLEAVDIVWNWLEKNI